MWLQRLRFELRMELASEEERVIRNLHDLHIGRIRRGARQPQPAAGQQSFILAVELIAMPVPFADFVVTP